MTKNANQGGGSCLCGRSTVGNAKTFRTSLLIFVVQVRIRNESIDLFSSCVVEGPIGRPGRPNAVDERQCDRYADRQFARGANFRRKIKGSHVMFNLSSKLQGKISIQAIHLPIRFVPFSFSLFSLPPPLSLSLSSLLFSSLFCPLPPSSSRPSSSFLPKGGIKKLALHF